MSTTILQIRKDHLPTTRWHERADEPLAPGQVRVRIDRFALTSNNITYAAFGEAMNYWRFYPSRRGGVGRHPGLGLCDRGRVHASRTGRSANGSTAISRWPRIPC
jgi:hypothetical protein